MSIIRSLLERRSITPQQLWGIGADDVTGPTASGQRVDQTTALKLVAIWSVTRQISNAISGLPFHGFMPHGASKALMSPQPSWIDSPIPRDPSVTRIEHIAQVVYSLILDSNSFTLCLPSLAQPGELLVLNPRRVAVGKDADGAPYYDIRDVNNRVIRRETAATVIHIPLMRKPGENRGQSMIEANQQAIGLGLAAEEYGARFFGTGATMSGVVEYPQGVETTPEQVKELLAGLNKKHSNRKAPHAIGALTGGAKYHELSVKPNEAQFVETQRWVVEQVGRMVGLPPHKLGSQEPGAVSYNSVEVRNIDAVNDALLPLAQRIELAYARLLPRPEQYLKFNFAGLLRGDAKTRWATYESGLRWGVYSLDDVRELEDMNPLDSNGDVRPFPLTYAPLDRVVEMPLPTDPPGPRPAPSGDSNA